MPKLTSNLVHEALRSVAFCGEADAAQEYLTDVRVPNPVREKIAAAASAVASVVEARGHGPAREVALRLTEMLNIGEGRNRLDEADHQLADQLRGRASTGESYARSSYGGSATSRSYRPAGYP